jgi:hypothetical protein
MADLMKMVEVGWWHWRWYFLLVTELSRNSGWIVPLDNLEEKSKVPCNDKYSYVLDHYILEANFIIK